MCGRLQRIAGRVCVACTGLWIGVSGATAQTGPSPEFALELRAATSAARGVLMVSFDEGTWDQDTQTYQWMARQPLDVIDPNTGARLATLVDGSLTVQVGDTVRCEVNVQVWAGGLDTQVEILVPPAIIIPLSESEAQFRASAAVTAADLDGDGALVSAVGPPGSGIYRTYVSELDGEEHLFSELVSSVFAGGGGVATGSQNDPPIGYRPVGFAVAEVRSEITFVVSAQDLATVVSSIRAIPTGRCAGDVNSDGTRDLGDLNRLLLSFGRCEGDPDFLADADLFPDGCVDLHDLSLMLRVFGVTCP